MSEAMSKAGVRDIAWAVDFGKRAFDVIHLINDKGYDEARTYFDFYSDKRKAHGSARRAVTNSKKVLNQLQNKGWYVGEDSGEVIIYALEAIGSLERGRPFYLAMKSF